MTAVTFPRHSPIFSSEHTFFKENFDSLPRHTRFTTHMPGDKRSEKMYRAANIILTPWKLSLQLLARTIEPFPGQNKSSALWGVAVRISSFVGLLLMLPFGIASLIPGIPLYIYAHRSRPYISVIDNSKNVPVSESKQSLDVRSYNVGFVHESMRIVGDLRPVQERAREIADANLQEKNSPDVTCFQEGFHQAGTKTLCDRLKEKYPFIIHNIGPHGVGFPSGKIIASKYRIEEVSFRILPHMIGPERLAPRGLVGVRIDLGDNRYANIYNAHLQSLLGKARADARELQLRQIVKWIDEDHAVDISRGDLRVKVGDFLMGDLNLSLITAWGDENPGEEAGAKFIAENFYNPFYEEHDENGVRKSGEPRFLDPEMPNLKEPTKTWYIGPFAIRGIIFRIKEWLEKKFRGFSAGKNVIPLEKPILWASAAWPNGPRTANTAGFDYQLVRRREGAYTPKGIAEIEHVKTTAQSAPSDHLPIRAVYDISGT